MVEMSGLDSSKLDLPPERLPSDSIQLLFLLVVLVLGVPSNLLILHRLLILHKTSRKNSSKATFLLLKLHLTVSDLMLLFFYAAPQLAWNITYEWIAGDFLCKFYNYISLASFYLSSNITACIAVDRLRTVLGALQLRKGPRKKRPIHYLLVLAWLLAFSFASPQLVVFETADILTNSTQTWIQCSDVWSFTGICQDRDAFPEWFLTPLAKLLYEVSHLLLVFWVPLLLLLLSYGTIAIRLRQVSSMDPQSHFSSMHGLLLDSKGRSMSMPDAHPHHGTPRLSKRLSLAPVVIRARLRSLSIASRGSDELLSTQGGSLWRRRIREKLFRSTLLIVISHFLFWLPYNISALLSQASSEYQELISLYAYFLNDLQIVITLVNPVLYAISE
ncbi:hypothetical protein PRIPAC_78585 [Pristionchus pacificus]|nr:hypothetical protein PRIPAC_78585 [Pristionchus pacificus]